uniref:F-box domain-containing protein n=1 Tax=Strongyloides stercoralis TaxID=6248 RepID=A0A913HXS2_STRER
MSFLRYFSLIPTHLETYFTFKNNTTSGGNDEVLSDRRRSRRFIRFDLSFEDVDNEGNCVFNRSRDDNELEKINDTESDKVSLWHFNGKSYKEEKISRNEKKRKNRRGKKRRRLKSRMTQSSQSLSTNYILHNIYHPTSDRHIHTSGKRRNLPTSDKRSLYKDIVAVQEPPINGFYYNYIIDDEMNNQIPNKKNKNIEKCLFTNSLPSTAKIPLQMQVTEFGEAKNKKVNCIPKKVKAKQRESYLITSMDGKNFDLKKKLEYMELKDEEENINDILPNEVLLRVFSYLDMKSLCQGAQVCKLWNSLAMNGANWMVVNFFDYQKDIKPSVVENISRRSGYFLRKLSLRGCQNIQDGALRIFAVNCRNIEALSLGNCKKITDLTCEYLGKYYITDIGVMAIVNNCTLLEEINFNWNKNIQDKGITYLLSRCKNLRKLLVKGCSGLTENCFGMLAKETFPLVHLNLMLTMATERTLNDISLRFTNLEYLNISNCNTINDNGIMTLSQSLRSLKTLEMAGGELLSDLSIQFVARFCKQIKKLDIEDCSSLTDNSLYYISKGSFNLEHLVLSHCEGITNNGIKILAEGCTYSLKELELDNLPEINDNVFEHLYEFKSLRKVCLFDCQNISKAAISKFEESRNYETTVQAYFAPPTPQVVDPPPARGICRCCTIL